MSATSHPSTLGHLLRERRIALKMTMREVAGKMLSPTAVNNIEKGKIKPSINTVFYLCQALQLKPELILLYYPDFSKSCPVLLRIVDTWLETGRMEEAITLLYDLYWVACERAEQASLLAEIQTRIGLAFGQAGCYGNARQVMRDTYNYYHQTNDIQKQIIVLNYIGNLLLAEHELNLALSSYRQAMELAIRFQVHDASMGETYLNLAHAFHQTKNLREALFYVHKAEAIYQKLDHPDGVAQSLLKQAAILTATERTTEAFRLCKQAYRHFAKTQNVESFAKALILLGDVLHSRQKFASAKACYLLAAEWLQEHVPHKRYEADVKLAQLELTRGNPRSARQYTQSALNQVTRPSQQSCIYQLLAQCELRLGHRENYVDCMEQAIRTLQKSGDSYRAALLQCELADVTDDLERMRAATRELRTKFTNK